MAYYSINKGIGKETEFRGFQGAYIYYLAAVALGSFFLFIGLYFIGVPNIVALIIVVAAFAGITLWLYRLNRKYGLHGLSQKAARKRRPKSVRAAVTPFRRIPTSRSGTAAHPSPPYPLDH